jgi:DNA-binding GntR family transcriptional regulator
LREFASVGVIRPPGTEQRMGKDRKTGGLVVAKPVRSSAQRTTTVPDDILADRADASQTQAALDLIRSRIIDLTLEPGSRIDERILIDRFRLGRTPAREAMNRLAAEGFVTMLAKRGGSYVRKLDLHEMGEVVAAQQLAETILAHLCRLHDPTLAVDLKAIQRSYVHAVLKRDYLTITELNYDFHLRMHRTIDNELFYDFAEKTHRHVRRLNVYVYVAEASDEQYQSSQFAANLDQHNQIIEAIERQDRPELVRLLPEHAKYTHRRLLRLLEAKSVSLPDLDLGGLPQPAA